MKYTEMYWIQVKKLEDEALIQEFEETVGYKFPDFFKEVIKNCNGGCPCDPETEEYLCFESEFGGCDSIGNFCDFNKNVPDSIWNAQFTEDDYEEELEFSGTDVRQFVIFADTPFGDQIGFKRDTDEVILFEHELGEYEVLAPDFKTFIESLFIYDEDEWEYVDEDEDDDE